MKWVHFAQVSFPGFIQFIIRNEWKSVSLSSRFVNRDNSIKHPSDITDTVFCLIDNGPQTVKGIILLSEEGLLLPLFEDNAAGVIHNGFGGIQNLLQKKGKVFCVLGFTPDVLHILNNTSLTIDTEREYNLLERPVFVSSRNRGNFDIQIKRAGREDVEKLYHLEKKYMLEEVLIHREHFHEKTVLNNLRRTCSSQIVFYLEKNGITAAKANTNALGINYAQIGGVFTDYTSRRKGYSSLIMEYLIHELAAMRKKSILFVQKSNAPANALYKKLGFREKGDYRITYIKY